MNPYIQAFSSALASINSFWVPGTDISILKPLESRIEVAWLQGKPVAIFKILCTQYVVEIKKIIQRGAV